MLGLPPHPMLICLNCPALGFVVVPLHCVALGRRPDLSGLRFLLLAGGGVAQPSCPAT